MRSTLDPDGQMYSKGPKGATTTKAMLVNYLRKCFCCPAMLVNEKEEEEERKKMTKSEFSSDLFLDSRILSGTFASVFVNC